jgi:hypothetical protein
LHLLPTVLLAVLCLLGVLRVLCHQIHVAWHPWVTCHGHWDWYSLLLCLLAWLQLLLLLLLGHVHHLLL